MLAGLPSIDQHPLVGLVPRSPRSMGRAVTKVLPRTYRITEGIVERTAVLIITWENGRRVAERCLAGPAAGLGGYVAYSLGLNVPGIVFRMVDFELRAVVVTG